MRKITNSKLAYIGISYQEVECLCGLSYLYQVLYLHLRAKVCYKTGLVGAKDGQRISLQALREWLYIEPGQGIKNAGSPTTSQIRTAIQALERCGLVEPKSVATKNIKQLILFLPMAIKDNFDQNKHRTFLARKSHEKCDTVATEINTDNSGYYEISSNKVSTNVADPEQAKVRTPLNKNISTLSLYGGEGKNSFLERFQPSKTMLQKIEELNLIKFHTERELQKFIAYYKSRPVNVYDWDSQYLRWLVRAEEYQQKGRKENGSSNYAHQREVLSAVDKVRQRNKELFGNKIIDIEID